MKLTHGNTEILLMDYELRHIKGGKGEVYGEVHCPAFAGLGITQSCILLCIANAKLNLKSQPVKLHYLFAAEREVGGEIYLRLPVFGIIYCSHNISMQCPAVESGCKELSLVPLEAELPEGLHVGIGEVHLAVHLFFAPLCTGSPGSA